MLCEKKKKNSVNNGKTITLVNTKNNINVSDNKGDHYIIFWQDSSDVISNKVSSVPVIIILMCIKNDKFAVGLLKNNDKWRSWSCNWCPKKR